MDNRLIYHQAIQSRYPDLQIRSATLNREGQNNDILFVNNDLIFRFPKYLQGIEELQRETAILNGIRPCVSLPVPNFIYQNLDNQPVGQAFVGYQMIPGEPLWTDTFARINSAKTVAQMAEDLASFLYELHNIPAEELITYQSQPFDTPAEWIDIYGRIRQVVFPHLSNQVRVWTVNRFERFLEHPESFNDTPVLRHGDFGTSNLLFNAQEQRISGIIDFGHAGIGDPAVDFAGLFISYSEAFLRQCCATYPQIEASWERIRFYSSGVFGLLDALFCLENDTAEAMDVIAELNAE